jgi:flagellar biosynthesis GTPase FlhF
MILPMQRQGPHWPFKAAVLAVSIVANFVVINASAQPFYPQNPIGQFLNGLQANIARQQAIAAARQAWNSVDPTMYQCLMRTLSPAPPVLANSGISPGDSRLQPYFQRCAAAIAQANAQRDAAARGAADEQQREQAAREAQQAEQACEVAEQQAQELEAKKAQQAEEQRRFAEQQAEKAAFTQVQAIPELSPCINPAEPALIYLYVTTSKRLMRGLDGKVSSVGDEHSVCKNHSEHRSVRKWHRQFQRSPWPLDDVC